MNEERIAIYIRLSNADEDTGKGKDESNSIVNQRSLIHRYLDAAEGLGNLPRQEFVDDGFSGTNTDRPAFREMIRQIRDGRFTVCITKDFSRFSRDYIEMGDYLECLFPFLKVRYISINDNYDSLDYKGTTGGMEVVMRNIVYDAYSKDLSVKVKTAQIQSAKKGRRVHGDPGFGYMPDPNHHSMDIVDPEAAKIVRRIFEAAMAGYNPNTIADMLNKENIPTPGQYYRIKHPNSKKFAGSSEKQHWNYSAVSMILDRYAYTGAAVNMMRGAVGPCQKKTVTHPKEKWIIVPNMHEAIVTVEEFEKAQEAIHRKPYGIRENKEYPLKSMVVCGACGRKMSRHKPSKTQTTSPRFYCKYGNEYGNMECGTVRSPRENELQRIVYDGIMNHIRLQESVKSKSGKHLPANHNKKYFENRQKQIEQHKHIMLGIYEQYASDLLSKGDFLARKETIETEIQRLEQEIASHKSGMPEAVATVNTEVESNCKNFKDSKELTCDMVRAFVDKIVVYQDQRIEIVWRYKDFYNETHDKEKEMMKKEAFKAVL